MATVADAEFGWQLYQDSHYSLSLREINKRLKENGFSPIAPRTFQHYQKLVRYGFASYLPINQLDVKTLQDPAWDAFIRARSLPRDTNLSVVLRLQDDDDVIQIRGRARKMSDAYAVIRVTGTRNIEALSRLGARPEQQVVIEFPDSGDVRGALIDAVTLEGARPYASVRVRFLTVEDGARLSGREVLSDQSIRLRLTSSDSDPLFGLVVQQLSWLYQAVDSARAMSEELLVEFRAEKKFAVAPPRVSTLTLQSPMELIVEVAAPATLLLLGAFHIARGRAERSTTAKGKKVAVPADGTQLPTAHDRVVQTAREKIQSEIGHSAASRRAASPRLEGLWLNQLYPSAERLLDSTDSLEAEEDEG